MQLDTTLAAFAIASHGGGVALGRTSLAAIVQARGQLVAPFALKVPISEAVYLVQPMGGAAHPDTDLFKAWLLKVLPQNRTDFPRV